MKRVSLTAFLSCFVLIATLAQETSRLVNLKINSEFLEQERSVKVFLPEEYSADKDYPVFYITDAETFNFDIAKNYIDILSKSDYDIIPQSILVGITQEDRNAELDIGRGENGKKFTNYIFKEVVSYIDSNYSTSGFNAMIGHSNGAEFNHFLMLEEGNPFRGFISISTNFYAQVQNEVADFFMSYDGAPMYCFVANGTLDSDNRKKGGNEFESLYRDSANSRIKFEKNTYNTDHTGLVPLSLLDGLTFIFQDYRNLSAYPTIMDYSKYYLADLKRNYGIKGSYSIQDTSPYWSETTDNKKVEEFEFLVDFIEDHGLWFGKGIDPVNIANAYFKMEMFPETISNWNKAIEEFDSVEPRVFYYNMSKAVKAYKAQGKLADAVLFLEKGREKLPEEYTLRMSYRIASLALKNQVYVEKGKKALEYCKANYEENSLFDLEKLAALESL